MPPIGAFSDHLEAFCEVARRIAQIEEADAILLLLEQQLDWDRLRVATEGLHVVLAADRPAYIEGAAEAYVPELPYWSANRIGGYSENAGRGDHASYWAAGIPAAALHDTSELRTDTYHRPSDLPDTLDYSFLERVSRATAAAVLHWAELEPMPETSPAVERP